MPSWRIHEGLIDGREGEMAAVLAGYGDPFQFVRGHYRNLPPPIAPTGRDGGLALTTLQDARALTGEWMATPGLYFSQKKYDVSFWLPRIAESIPVLNRRSLFVPAGLVQHIATPFWSLPFPSSSGLLFVRPDSGMKPFAGFVLDAGARRLKQWPCVAAEVQKEAPGLAPETLLCISSGRHLCELEWRFWIVDRKVVASSPYSWQRDVTTWVTPPPEAQQIAEAMAGSPWQPDIAYVVDVVQLAEGDMPFYLNEINAASTSGLYCVPFAPLIAALRDAVQREIAGELTVED